MVTCERKVVHKYTEKNKLPINFSMNIKSSKFVSRTSQEKFANYKSQQDEFYQNIKLSILKKLKLLKQGNYMGTKEIYLCICSVFEEKPYIDIERIARIYKEASLLINENFDMVFLLVNSNLYMITNEYKFALLEDYKDSKINVHKIHL